MEKGLRKFIIVGGITVLLTTAGSLIAPIEVRFLSKLTSNTVLIGFTYAFGTILFSILSLWLGRLSDRIGREKLIFVGFLTGVIYPLLYASTYNIFQYMGVKFVYVFSAIAVGPLFSAYLQDILKDNPKKGQYMGTLYSVQAISGSIGALLGGYLSDIFSLRAPYYVLSLFFLIASIIIVTQFSFHSTIKTKPKKKHALFAFKYVFNKPILLFWFWQNMSFNLNWGIKAILWPLIIYNMTGKDLMTGMVFATMGVSAFIILPFSGKFADKKGPIKSLFVSTFILGTLGMVLALTDNITLFWIAAGIYAVGEAINGPAESVLLTDNIESEHRGEILGFNSVIDSILKTFSPFLAGIGLVYFSPQKVLLFYIILYWIMLFVISLIYKKHKKVLVGI